LQALFKRKGKDPDLGGPKNMKGSLELLVLPVINRRLEKIQF
jgi:hypothetical protein